MTEHAENQVTLEQALTLAQRHHNAGNLMIAEQTYKDILKAVPDHFPTIHYLGILLYEAGRLDEAVECLAKTVEVEPDDPDCWSNYAVMLAESKKYDEAIEAFHKSLALNDSSAETHSNLANALWLTKDYKGAEKAAKQAVKLNPKNADAHLNLGNAYQAQEQYDKAIKSWKKTLEINPHYHKALNNIAHALRIQGHSAESEEYCRKALTVIEDFPEAWNNLGNALFDQGKIKEAEEAFRKATNFKPDYEQAHNNVAICLLETHRYEEAIASARYAITFKPDYAEPYSTLSIACRELGDIAQAEQYARKAIELSPDNAELHLNLVDILLNNDRLEDAQHVVENALKLSPDTPVAYSKLANIQEQMGNPDAALEAIQKGLALNDDFLELHIRAANIHHINNEMDKAMAAIEKAGKIAKDNPNVLGVKADILQSMGDMQAAEKLLDSAIAKNSNIPSLYFSLSKVRKLDKDSPEFPKLKELAKHQNLIGIQQACSLNFALFSVFQNSRQYKKAFDALKAANDYRRKLVPYNATLAGRQYETLKERYGKGYLDEFKGKGCQSDIPVFIVGMPRSGTTLTEQIISSHPEVYGAGELPYFSRFLGRINKITPDNVKELGQQYVEKIKTLDPSGEAKRITDKMPGNFARMAEIVAALPNAKIIHCRRDPMDTCLSCYKQNFARGQYWSYNLAEMAAEYRRYADLMEHWRKVLPEGSFIEIDYEDTVADLETQARKLIDYVGLEWDEACLSPHKNKRAVLTASKAQVIRPVYSSSVKAWKRYEKQLQPLIEGLGDLGPQQKQTKTATKKKG